MSTIAEQMDEFHQDLERRESLEHRDVILAMQVLLKTKEGIDLFSYLFKNLDVTCVPEAGLSKEELHEYLGFLRAGNSVYKLACEANSEKAASILAKLERKRYDDTYEQYRIENGLK